MQIRSQVEQLAAVRILQPLEVSMSDSDSSPKSDSAESAGRALSASPSKKRGSAGAVHGSALFGSALLARVDDLVQKCLTTKAGIKDMRTRSLVTADLSWFNVVSAALFVHCCCCCMALALALAIHTAVQVCAQLVHLHPWQSRLALQVCCGARNLIMPVVNSPAPHVCETNNSPGVYVEIESQAEKTLDM